MVALTNPKGDGVLVIGGENDPGSVLTNKIYEFRCTANICYDKWKLWPQKLTQPRSQHVAMLVQKELLVCNGSESQKHGILVVIGLILAVIFGYAY